MTSASAIYRATNNRLSIYQSNDTLLGYCSFGLQPRPNHVSSLLHTHISRAAYENAATQRNFYVYQQQKSPKVIELKL